jgi:hypothetical protein
MRWSRRRREPGGERRHWNAPVAGPFQTVTIHAPLAIELVALDRAAHPAE